MKTKMIKVVLIGLGLLCLVGSKLFASTADIYGLSSRASATSGLSTFTNADPAFVYQNPSFLTQAKRVTLHLSWLRSSDQFAPIDGVVTENARSGKSLKTGPVDTNYSNLSGLAFGLILPVRKTFPKWSLGTTGFIPFGSIATIRSLENYVPVYANYYNRPKRFSLVLGSALEPFENFSLGVGANIYLTAGANTKVNLNETNSTVSLAMDIVPAASPIVGAKYQWKNWNLHAAYHGKVDYAMSLQNITELPLLKANGKDASIPVVEFLSKSSMFFDPQQVTIGLSHLISGWFQVGLQTIWKNWKQYKMPLNNVEFSNPGEIKSKLPDVRFKDIWSLGAGVEFPVGAVMMRAGYRFEPEHIEYQEANSNLLDTNVHVVSTGLGYTFKSLMGVLPKPLHLDFHVQYHHLEPKRILKTDPTAVGYKEEGYILGGSLLNYGVTLGTTF